MPEWMHNWDSPQMHFAVGMVCAGALWLLVLLARPAWWVYLPLVMTAGGLWAEGPDLPLLFKYYPSLGLGLVRGQHLSETLHGRWANLFFFHGWIDRSGDGGALRGWVIATVLYNACFLALLAREHWTR
jgi:hypothetical protein